ncbi:MAG: hypothetical protein KUG80_03025 [Gammaproteobacteria bacterium]|nr:hypothetical protein [Gammaproteobacteria bacterium]
MIKKIVFLVLSMCSLNAISSELRFDELGFKMQSLSNSSMNSHQVVMLTLPPENDFSSNVTVMIQEYDGTLAEYKALTLEQFKKYGISLVNVHLAKKYVVFEYVGITQGKELHWYAKAIKKEGVILLATGSSLDELWAKDKGKLIKSVNSMKLIKK